MLLFQSVKMECVAFTEKYTWVGFWKRPTKVGGNNVS